MTPLMQQYWDIKSKYPDHVMLFRMGDFFEMFHQDAEVAAPILNIALTVRNRKSGDETKMCGVPHHSVAGPIAKLLAAGHKVAIADQIEDPAEAKGLVKRAVTRVLTPGVVYDPETLDEVSANYLTAFDAHYVAFLDVSTGERFHYQIESSTDQERLWSLLRPVEVILTSKQRAAWRGADHHPTLHLSVFDEDLNEEVNPPCCQRLLQYSLSLQGETLARVVGPSELRRLKCHLEMSPTTLRHLEIFQNVHGEKKGSLFHSIDHTRTAIGARKLKSWMAEPLLDLDEIEERQDQISFWMSHVGPLNQAREIMRGIGDVERRLGRLAMPNCGARDIYALAQGLRAGLNVAPLCPGGLISDKLLQFVGGLVLDIERALVDDPPLGLKVVGSFRAGINPDLDELIKLTEDAQGLLLELESREKERTGIPSLKVRYNQVFGYYIEVTKTHVGKVPPHYRRKQTLTQAERFVTDELQVLEDKVLSAHAKRQSLEQEMFLNLRDKVLDSSSEIQELIRHWAELDVVTSLAWLAVERKYVRPKLKVKGDLDFDGLRHPVIEMAVSKSFVPNSLHMPPGECMLLTGPNMAGKSTLMRQVALAVILAQMGSFVPATRAELPLFERVLTRIGASDDLSQGLSTFMVEMKETAEILKTANAQSLVILDEIGRGTSTYDGMSLAQAILEQLVSQNRPTLFFATHYHELTSLAHRHPQITNAHMSIRDRGGDVQFLYTLQKGPANKSYGIHVARLAGLPSSVTKRAEHLLQNHELGGSRSVSSEQLYLVPAPPQSDSVPEAMKILVDEVKSVPLQQMTPIEALNQIAQWQKSLS